MNRTDSSGIHRRRFLAALTVTAATGVSLTAWKRSRATEDDSLVILHTNDTHSYMEPFPKDHSRFAGMGGASRRAALIRKLRQQHKNVLLVDCGDIFQGTPYFNLFGGELEFKVMSAMGYDFATLGNHDFDNGVDGLVRQLPHASFQFLSANYDVTGSALQPHVEPTAIRDFGNIKVGLFGLGIEFSGLVLEQLHRGVVYQDPVVVAQKTVDRLKNQGCNLIVCLSHLGYRSRGDRVTDLSLAEEVPGIDLILGGHSHTFLDEPTIIRHRQDEHTMIHQVGWAGLRLGRIDVHFSADKQPLRTVAGNYPITGRLDRVLS